MQWSNIADKKSFLCWTVHLNNNSNNKMLWEEADLLLQHNKDLFGKKFREKCKKKQKHWWGVLEACKNSSSKE